MSKKFKIEDFKELALSMKPSLIAHDVPQELHYSLISDILFHCANLIDEKTGTSFHEQVDGLMDDFADLLNNDEEDDYLVAELEIMYRKGRKDELNILKSHLENKERLMMDIEVSLYIRDIDELDKKIDVGKVFSKRLEKKEGIKHLRFKSAKDFENDNWLLVPLKSSEFGTFEDDIEGIFNCIHSVTKKWV